MISMNDSIRETLIAGFVKGRIPFRVWFFAALVGSSLMIVNNLVHHDALLQGFFSLLFLNLAITIPLFLSFAHFVGKALQKNFKRTQSTVVAVLIIGWAITGTIIGVALQSIYSEGWNSGLALMVGNFSVQFTMWILLAYFTTTRKLAKKTQ